MGTNRNLQHPHQTRLTHTVIPCLAIVLSLLAAAPTTKAQGITNPSENTNLWKVVPGFPWQADSLYLGATFLRDTSKTFLVWLDYADAGWTGKLHLMVPGGANNGGDTAIYLFQNKNNTGPTRIDLTNNPVVQSHLHYLDTIFFRYSAGPDVNNPAYIGYSGPNRNLADTAWQHRDRYWSTLSANKILTGPPPTSSQFKVWRRFCAAGWIHDQTPQRARTDTVEFAYEDNQTTSSSDFDFNDNIFHVMGVFLIRPALITDIHIDAEPTNDTIFAGDSIAYKATVVLDSIDSLGFHHIVYDSVRRANQVYWQIQGDTTGGKLVSGRGPVRKNTFTATMAYRTYDIVATIVDSTTGRTVSKALSVYVLPSNPFRLVVENAPDVGRGLSLTRANPIDTLRMTAGTARDSVYAIIRDRFGNYTGLATNAGWDAIPDTSLVTAKDGNTALGEGVIAKTGANGTGRVWSRNDSDPSNALMRDTFVVVVDPASYNDLRFVVGTGGQKRVISSLTIGLGSDTVIYSEAHRTDGVGGDAFDGWVRTSMNWWLSPSLSSDTLAPSPGSRWVFSPINDTGTGIATLRQGSLRDTLQLHVVAGTPASYALYAQMGQPTGPTGSNPPYDDPSILTYQWAAGVSYPLVGKVFDGGTPKHWLPSLENGSAPISWEARFTSTGLVADASVGVFSTAQGAITSFTPHRAYTALDIISTFGQGLIVRSDTVRVRIGPGAATHLLIESSSDSTVSLNADNPLSQVQLSSSDTTRSVYAILRDSYGNWVSRATAATWWSIDTLVATTLAGSPQSTGVIRRVTTTAGQTFAVSAQGAFSDSVRVVVDNITYTAIEIRSRQAGLLLSIDTLRQRTDQDTTLCASGLRSDNGKWVSLVAVTWDTVSLRGVVPPISTVDHWTFRPTLVDTGWIRITLGSAKDSVRAFFLPGLPNSVVLHRRDGTPPNTPYSATTVTDTLIAGRDTSLFAMLFDDRSVWLSAYRDTNAAIDWSIAQIDGPGAPGTLRRLTGYKTVFSPVNAYNTFEISAVLRGTSIRDVVRFYVKPGTATHLVIEDRLMPLQANLNRDNPLAVVTLRSTDSVATAYAVLRDALGNYVSPSLATTWTSLNPAVVTTAEGVAFQGEGRIFRQAPNGNTSIVARNRTNPALVDTVAVNLSDITYDSMRIVTRSGSDWLILDSLVLRTDQDTTLYAQGKRSDGRGWDNIGVQWTPPTMPTRSLPTPGDDHWVVQPADTGRGTISIGGSGTTGTISDLIRVQFIPGLPARIVLYPDTTMPDGVSNVVFADPTTAVSVTAGDSLRAVAMVFDHRGVWLSQFNNASSPVAWQTIELNGLSAGPDTVRPASGFRTWFKTNRAHNEVYVVGTFNNQAIRDTIRVSIEAGSPNHLVLEGSSDPNVSPNADNRLYSISLNGSTVSYDDVYAILRDRFGNWVDYSKTTGWASFDTAVVTATEGDPDFGQGFIGRVATSERQTRVAAWSLSDPTQTDTIDVRVTNVTYDSLRIRVLAGRLVDLDTLVVRTDQDTVLFAAGRRTDNGNWVNIPVRWTAAGVRANPSAPASADQWSFSPVSAGNGVITATAAGVTGQITDRIVVIFTPGLPHDLAIYNKVGQPGINDNLPYAPPTTTDTITAGDTVLLVGKLFDHNAVWLDAYERATAPVSWSVVELSGNPPTGKLLPRTGYLSRLIPENAYNTIYAIATFDERGIVLRDTVRFYVKPGAPTHLVIEPGSNPMSSPNSNNPAGTITLSSRDTVRYVYAVLRDQFGNFVSFSTSTDWNSLDTALITADDGITTVGEGRMIRISRSGGQTSLIGQSNAYPGFADTVSVVLSTISYDSLRVVINDTTRIERLEMRTDQDTTLLVQGLRSDNGLWESVPATWVLSPGLSTQPAAPTSSSEWSFTPANTGAGWIRVTLGNDASTKPDTVLVMFKPGPAARLVLYPDLGSPTGANPPYPAPATAWVVTAGQPVTLVAKLLDHSGVFLRDTVATWSVEELAGTPPTGALQNTSTTRVTFTPVKAYNLAYIVANVTTGAVVMRDTLYVSVRAGAAHHLVVEADQNWQFSPYADNSVDSITLTDMETFRSLYAIVRDSLGNFVGYSQRTTWQSLDTTIAAAADGITTIGEGVVQNKRIGKDTTTWVIAASREYPGLADTVTVQILRTYFTDLRIVVGDSTSIDRLVMTTNDDTTLHVQGRRNDTHQWVNISAKWLTSVGLGTDPAAPEMAHEWSFSPVTPDTGWIAVMLGSDSSSVWDTIDVFFGRGEPTRVSIDLLTPPEECIAGDTLVAVVRIRNADGPVPGSYCDDAVYQDLFGSGGRVNTPVVILSDTTGGLNRRPSTANALPECFVDGVDTVRFVLYYAPHDSLNQLYARISGNEGTTAPFKLLPAPLSQIVIEDNQGKPMGDSVAIRAPNGYLYIFANGYDQYGNKIGSIPGDWGVIADTTATVGQLHDAGATRSTRLYYGTTTVQYDERGYIWVRSSDHPEIAETLFVSIVAPAASLVWAVTRDANGNGYLDQITVKFSKLVSFDEEYDFSNVVIVKGSWRLHVDEDAMDPLLGVRDTVFTLVLVEDSSHGMQTDWKPGIALRGVSAADTMVEAVCADGAGPVIWKATREIVSDFDRTQDIIKVTFSEAVRGIVVSDTVKRVFYVWTRSSDSSFTRLTPHPLDGIGESGSMGFLTSRDDKVVKFVMSNGFDLSSEMYLNIVVTTRSGDTLSKVRDAVSDGNLPEIDNRRVQVFTEPQKPRELLIGPNPAPPDPSQPPLTLKYVPEDQVRQMLATGAGGTFMRFQIVLPPSINPDQFPQISASIKIYDVAGNPVAQASEDDLLGQDAMASARQGGVINYTFHWNGCSDRKMRVAPGVYRTILILHYMDRRDSEKPITGVVGIRR